MRTRNSAHLFMRDQANTVIFGETQTTSYQNLSAKPCEDFYEHACGGFHDPESFLFENNARFQKTVINRVYDVVRKTSDFASRPKQLLKIFVDKCAEWKADNSDFKDLLTDIEMQGGFPLVNKNWDEQTFDFSDALAERFQKNPNTVSFLSVKRHIVFVSGKQENRLLLSPGPHWYHSQPNHRLELFKDKIGYIIYRLATFSNKLLNQAEYDIEFKKLVELEANLIKFASKNDTPESLISVDELEDLVPEVNWVGILSKMTNNSFNGRELKQKTSVLNQDNFFAKYGTLSRLINETPKRVLANYLVARQLVDFSFFLPYQHSTCADTNNSVMQNNLAEKFSLIIAFKAFQKVGKLDKFRLPGYRRINNVQQFFYSFAMGICTDGREPRIKEWVNANLRELPDFATAFECSTVLK
uniref:Peptidase M13 N-terminal domain-containing protein n=2 Tax=Caenorhabditis japonica TaxID=281687 RepID=A0A8R1HNJ7_CAEJA